MRTEEQTIASIMAAGFDRAVPTNAQVRGMLGYWIKNYGVLAQKRPDQSKVYASKPLKWDMVEKLFPEKQFEALWTDKDGNPVRLRIEAGDRLVIPYDPCDAEIYRIEAVEFKESYDIKGFPPEFE